MIPRIVSLHHQASSLLQNSFEDSSSLRNSALRVIMASDRKNLGSRGRGYDIGRKH